MIRIFMGWDDREAIGCHTFIQSLVDKTSDLVAITPIADGTTRDGSNSFTYSRFLVPYLCDFQGWALWCDGADMVMAGDIAELWEHRQGYYAVQVVKHEYTTKHPTKYVGTEMETSNKDYSRKNWSSVILWDCGHYMNRVLTPEYVREQPGSVLHRFGWLPDDRIGSLPKSWNWLAQEAGASTTAKLIHFTAGIPAIKAYRADPHANLWHVHSARTMQSPAERIAEVSSER